MRARHVLLLATLLGTSCALAQLTKGPCQTYILKPGDSVLSIAKQYGILNVDDLTSAFNDCIPGWSPATLQVGQQVCLPGYSAACKFVSGSASCKAYIVQEGDTLDSIASSLKLYSGDVKDTNPSAPSPLQPGTFIKLPYWDASSCAEPNSNNPSCRVYVVSQGDSIASIANAFLANPTDVLAVNPGVTLGSPLQVSQRVNIPPFPDTCKGSEVLATPPTNTATNCRQYQVQPNDSLSSIALKFAISTADLVSVNAELADPSLLTPGKYLKVPPYGADCVSPVTVTGNTNPTPSDGGSPPQAVPSPDPSLSPMPGLILPVAAAPSPSFVAAPTPTPAPADMGAPEAAPFPGPRPAAAPSAEPAPVDAPMLVPIPEIAPVAAAEPAPAPMPQAEPILPPADVIFAPLPAAAPTPAPSPSPAAFAVAAVQEAPAPAPTTSGASQAAVGLLALLGTALALL